MFIQTVAQSVIARARKLRPFLTRPAVPAGDEKPGWGGVLILVIAFLLVLLLGLK